MDWATMGGHGVIAGLVAWLIRALSNHGIDVSFRIWTKNGKDRPPQ